MENTATSEVIRENHGISLSLLVSAGVIALASGVAARWVPRIVEAGVTRHDVHVKERVLLDHLAAARLIGGTDTRMDESPHSYGIQSTSFYDALALQLAGTEAGVTLPSDGYRGFSTEFSTFL